jgi:broad specificity phosphatase PhoE
MTSIYLVRHGQTAWNKEEIFRGRSDVPLDETGKRQAELAGEYLKERKIHAIYSSPLARARETALRIASFFSLDVQPLPGMIDMSFGEWEGRPLAEIRRTEADLYRQWRESPQHVKFRGGESLDQVSVRAMTALEDLIGREPEKNLIVVSHRVVNKVIICGILGIDLSYFWQIAQDAAAINLIQFKEGKYVLTLLNETCHLKLLGGEAKIDF